MVQVAQGQGYLQNLMISIYVKAVMMFGYWHFKLHTQYQATNQSTVNSILALHMCMMTDDILLDIYVHKLTFRPSFPQASLRPQSQSGLMRHGCQAGAASGFEGQALDLNF